MIPIGLEENYKENIKNILKSYCKIIKDMLIYI